MERSTIYLNSVLAWHRVRDRTKESVTKLNDSSFLQGIRGIGNSVQLAFHSILKKFIVTQAPESQEELLQSYSHIFRRKTIWELIMASGAVCGIEFCYAAETAFVSPTLLSLGLDVRFMTMVWCLSPLIGFFVTPLLGSLSDGCRSKFGRRRPFIVLLSIGILLGLVLVPNGHSLGIYLGDPVDPINIPTAQTSKGYNTTLVGLDPSPTELPTLLTAFASTGPTQKNGLFENPTTVASSFRQTVQRPVTKKKKKTKYSSSQPWSILFTVVGTVLLDFCSDACQSPARTYLLDVTIPDDHGRGLTTFTMMAGLGGSVGYLMSGIDWEATTLGNMLGGHVKAVFAIVTVFFFICLISTLASFPEIPLDILRNSKIYNDKIYVGKYENFEDEIVNEKCTIMESQAIGYGTTENSSGIEETSLTDDHARNTPKIISAAAESDTLTEEATTTCQEQPTLKYYLLSILKMPKSLQILCLTNLFCWMSLVCYSLYFTDFVGESVYGGDPREPEGSPLHDLYEEGVRFGCLGMALYSISCSAYSLIVGILVDKFGARPVYVCGQLAYTLGMIITAITRHKIAVILLSPTAGIMYSTLFTMPYLLIAHYHCRQKFDSNSESHKTNEVRGIGTDIAIVSCMVFLAQFILSLSMGSIVAAVKSSVATVYAAAILSACGAICATQVFYLDL